MIGFYGLSLNQAAQISAGFNEVFQLVDSLLKMSYSHSS
jgi:hypothetical protein